MVHQLARALGAVVVVVSLASSAVACGGSAQPDQAGQRDQAGQAGQAGQADEAPQGSERCTNVTSTKTTHRYARTSGVAADLQSLDLYRPDLHPGCPAAPVVVYVHGGGWLRGDKANKVDDKVALFAEQLGWVFVSVNYRLSPDPIDLAAPNAVRAPVHAQDVAAAVAWVRQHVADSGGDPDRIALVGHSAGAHLVSELGTDQSLLAAAGVPRGSVPCVASLDTQAYDVAYAVAVSRRLHENAFGTDPARWPEWSPIHQITAGEALPAFLVVAHTARPWLAQSRAFTDALTAAGGRAELVPVPLDHAGINAAVGRPGDTIVTPPLTRFLRDCFAA